MTDLALVWDPINFRADLAVVNGDLVTDEGLTTAAIISLMTDRVADADAFIPDGTDDRRGWWGDLPFDENDNTPEPDRIGSQLWLLSREKQTAETARRAEHYAREALKWMVDDDVADRVDAVASFPRLGWLELRITIWKGNASVTFSPMWALT